MTNSSQKKLPISSRLAVLLGVTLLLLAIVLLLRHIEKQVDKSYSSYSSSVSEDPSVLLNHANTYYWFARYKKNTIPEFEKSILLAQKAKLLLEDSTAIVGNRDDARSMIDQANQIIDRSQDWLSVSRLNINSVVPFYSELMGYDVGFAEDDSDQEHVPIRSVQRGIKKVLELGSPDDREVPVNMRVAFALVVVPDDEPELEEVVVQQLNSGSQMYTISRHEIAKFTGSGDLSIAEVVTDSMSMLALSEAFNTDEIAVFNIIKNDVVDGIHYYGIRLDIWSAESANVVSNWYTEVMLLDRVFNQMIPLILPLGFVFILLSLIIALIVNVLSGRDHSVQSIPIYHVVLSFSMAFLAFWASVTFFLIPFVNPGPDALYFDPAVELWLGVLPLTILALPSFVSYIALGKLDNWIRVFESKLNTPTGLFSWLCGSLLLMPLTLTNLHILRFGFGDEVWLLPILVVMVASQSWILSHYLHTVFNYPWRTALVLKITVAVAIGLHTVLLLLSVLFFFLDYSFEMIIQQLIYGYLPVSTITLAVSYVVKKKYYRPLHVVEKMNEPLRPSGFTEEYPKIRFRDGRYEMVMGVFDDIASGSRIEKTVNAVLLDGKQGVNPSEIVEQLLLEPGSFRYYHVDMSAIKPEGDDTHYYPFALAFSNVFSKSLFNDVAEKARKAGNLLGQLISNISSVGGILVDEGESRPRIVSDVARDILDFLNKGPSIILCSHLEQMAHESSVLLQELLQQSLLIEPRRRPLLLLAYNKSFSEQQQIKLLAKKYGDLENESGWILKIDYNRPAYDVLGKWNLPIQARILLAEEFEQQNKDASPDVVEDILIKMSKSGVIRSEYDQNQSFREVDFDYIRDLPEFEPSVELKQLLLSDDAVSHVLLAASYAANESGKFPLRLLERMTAIPRMDLLFILRQLEQKGYIHDVRSEDDYDWFEFSDERLITEVKETENAAEDKVSQLTREFYKHYVEYYCPNENWDENVMNLKRLHRVFGRADLYILAQRAMKVKAEFPHLAEKLNVYAANALSEPSVAQFDFALNCIENALSLDHGEKRLEYSILKLKIMNDKGSSMSETMSIIEEIESTMGYHSQMDVAQNQRTKLEIAKFCFIHFDLDNKQKGDAICDQVIKESKDEEILLRAEFYKLKLIPGAKLRATFGESKPSTHDLQTLIQVRNSYRSIIDRLSISSSSELNKQLLGEVLNDYAGSLLVDKILGVLVQIEKLDVIDDGARAFKEAFESIDLLINEIDQCLLRRLGLSGLETEGIHSIRNLDVPNLETWLFSEKNLDPRGLCYTLNYMNRAFLSLGEVDYSIQLGKLSYKLNRHVRDYRGCNVVSGILGKTFAEKSVVTTTEKLTHKAFQWLERSFGYTWLMGQYHSAKQPAWSMLDLAIDHRNRDVFLNGDSSIYLRKAMAYMRQIEIAHLLTHMDSRSITAELGRIACLNEKSMKLLAEGNEMRSVFSLGFASKPKTILAWIESFYRYCRSNSDLKDGGTIRLFTDENVADISFTIHRHVKPSTPTHMGELEFSICFLDTNTHLEWYHQGVGSDNLIDINSDELRSKCQKSTRSGYSDVNILKGMQPKLTQTLVGVVHYREYEDAYQVVTAFPGTWAPKFPNQCTTDDKRKESTEFWDNHAFIS